MLVSIHKGSTSSSDPAAVMMERGARSCISIIDQQPFHHCSRIPHHIDPISVDDDE